MRRALAAFALAGLLAGCSNIDVTVTRTGNDVSIQCRANSYMSRRCLDVVKKELPELVKREKLFP